MKDFDELSYWQRVFSTFILGSSAALGRPYFYLLRTNSKWSLCLLSGLPTSIYSALLLKCKLVKIKGNAVVMTNRKQWDAFQTSSGMQGDAHGCGGCMELTNAKIIRAALFEEEGVDDCMSTKLELDVLRVGKVPPGKAPPSNTAINSKEEPP